MLCNNKNCETCMCTEHQHALKTGNRPYMAESSFKKIWRWIFRLRFSKAPSRPLLCACEMVDTKSVAPSVSDWFVFLKFELQGGVKEGRFFFSTDHFSHVFYSQAILTVWTNMIKSGSTKGTNSISGKFRILKWDQGRNFPWNSNFGEK